MAGNGSNGTSLATTKYDLEATKRTSMHKGRTELFFSLHFFLSRTRSALSSADPSPLSVRVFGRLPVPLDIQQDRFFIKIYVPLSIWPNHFSASPYFFFTPSSLSSSFPLAFPPVFAASLCICKVHRRQTLFDTRRVASRSRRYSSSTFNASE